MKWEHTKIQTFKNELSNSQRANEIKRKLSIF